MYSSKSFSVEIKGQELAPGELAEIVKNMKFGEGDSTKLQNNNMSVSLDTINGVSTVELSKIPEKILVGKEEYTLVKK